MNPRSQKFSNRLTNVPGQVTNFWLLEKRQSCNDKSISRELGISIKKVRTNLQNDYFSKLANNIRSAEARKIEEEFHLCKTYTMSKHSDINLIPS